MKKVRIILVSFMTLCALFSAVQIQAFCGFYVAKADTKLFNNKSEVILVRDGNHTTITMSNDFKGDVSDFAMVVPVPTVLKEDQIRVVNPSIFSKLDDYSGPRLVEYFDQNPCQPVYKEEIAFSFSSADFAPTMLEMVKDSEKSYSVTIEAQYEVGEYDILILSAKESSGLKRWLTDNGYKIPDGAEEVLDPYIKNQLKFFVVKVNLNKLAGKSPEFLSPIQIEFDSDRFMLHIRLGMANSTGTQDMIVYALTREGRVECANYRTVEIPTNRNIPTFVQSRFGEFYKDLFDRSYAHEGGNAIFLEYAWNVSPTWPVKCDPCNGPPPVNQDLVDAGADWIQQGAASDVFFTRLHVRYSRNKFPQDLLFQVTPNREQFQGRYVMTHAATGDFSCEEGQEYLRNLQMKRKKEVDELVALTGWNSKHSENYVKEYENRLHRQEVGPIWNEPGGGSGGLTWGLLSLVLLFSLSVSIWLSRQLRRPVAG
jgi:hypothetical protein